MSIVMNVHLITYRHFIYNDYFRLGFENENFASASPNRLKELKPLGKTLYNLKLNDNGFRTLPGLLRGNVSFAKLRSLDISHNPIKGKGYYI